MGLSNEERISKFFWTAMGWRRALSALALKVGDERVSWYTDERAEAVVRGWIADIDTMVGTVHLKTGNRGNVFWLLGEGDSTLRGLVADTYGLGRDAAPPSPFDLSKEPEYESVRWWSEKADHAFTAGRLVFPPFKGHKGLEQIALWWDAYGYMSGLGYPLNRYEDKVFPDAVHERFTALCGQIINRRFEVCFGSDTSDEGVRVEQYLLCKHNIFHALLDEETKKRKGDDYFKKKFNGYALYERVATMSAKDMHEFFEKQSKAKWDWERKYNETERKKKEAQPKPDGLFGPPAPAEETPPVPPKRSARKKAR